MARRERVRVTTPVGDRSRVKQSFAEESDVNAIMRKYLVTGMEPLRNRTEPRYGDFTSGSDYFDALTRVRNAERLFLEMPSPIRDHVNNDPRQLLDLVFDPARRAECVELGLVSEAPPEVTPPEEPEGSQGASGMVPGAPAPAASSVPPAPSPGR